ncbi:MAG: hypothetical protein ABII07_05775 [Patescibacteria group bacterium]|nr:hypothetical protein [Patescibacteria group bacterium]
MPDKLIPLSIADDHEAGGEDLVYELPPAEAPTPATSREPLPDNSYYPSQDFTATQKKVLDLALVARGRLAKLSIPGYGDGIEKIED